MRDHERGALTGKPFMLEHGPCFGWGRRRADIPERGARSTSIRRSYRHPLLYLFGTCPIRTEEKNGVDARWSPFNHTALKGKAKKKETHSLFLPIRVKYFHGLLKSWTDILFQSNERGAFSEGKRYCLLQFSNNSKLLKQNNFQMKKKRDKFY